MDLIEINPSLKFFRMCTILLKITVCLKVFRNRNATMMNTINPIIRYGEVIVLVSFSWISGLCFKKRIICPNCEKITIASSIKSETTSIKRSATTVPNNFVNDIFSYLARTPHRETSPIRGKAIFIRYPIITAIKVLTNLGLWPIGSIISPQRNVRLMWLINPIKSETIIQK